MNQTEQPACSECHRDIYELALDEVDTARLLRTDVCSDDCEQHAEHQVHLARKEHDPYCLYCEAAAALRLEEWFWNGPR